MINKLRLNNNIFLGPAFITPEKPHVLEGGRVTLVCGAAPSGYPQPTYKWWKEGSTNTVLATGASFTIDSARIKSGGWFDQLIYN